MCRGVASATTTVVGGTPAYMAPERNPPAGQLPAKPTAASDMYSLGVMLLLAFFPTSIEPVESRSVSIRDALRSVRQTMEVDFPGLHPLLQRLTSSTPDERCTITELLEQDLFPLDSAGSS